MGPSRLTQKVKITSQTHEEMLDNQEDDGRSVLEVK
jgi:hypothetical protein